MKRSVTLSAVVLIAFVCFIAVFVATAQISRLRPLNAPPVDYNSVYEQAPIPQLPSATTPGRESDLLVDPNRIRAKLKAFEGLDKLMIDLDRQSQGEMREWLQRTTDNRSALAKATERQVRAELEVIRKIAAEEKANKTVAAIDGLMLVRQERTVKLVRKMDEEARTLRQPRTIRGRSTRYGTPETGQAATGGVSGTEAYPPAGTQPGTGQEDLRRSRRR